MGCEGGNEATEALTMIAKPWWIWRWVGGGGNSVSVKLAPTKAVALCHASQMSAGSRPLVVAKGTLKRVTQAEWDAFDRELYLMWC